MAYDSSRDRTVLWGGYYRNELMTDTWEFDGTSWEQLFPAETPPGRYAHLLAYDPLTASILVAGGRDANFWDLQDHWRWDGTEWIDEGISSALGRGWSRGVTDTDRARIVMHGGLARTFYEIDTWEWNGWVFDNVTNLNLWPPFRAAHGFAYDPRFRLSVLFGGFQNRLLFNDTWTWDGVNWVEVATQGPSPRTTVMDFDPTTRKIVLFGGSSAAGLENDTWTWDGTAWVELQVSGPSARSDHALSGDPEGLLVFGGWDGVSALGDTWRFANGAWMEIPFEGPGALGAAASVWDSTTEELLVYGGWDVRNRAELWSWNGTRWLERPTTGTPPGRSSSPIVQDPNGGFVVFGGYGPTEPQGDTWRLTDGTWTELPQSGGPPARSGHVLFAHSGSVWLFGGEGAAGRLDDHWRLDGDTWVDARPAVRPPATQNAAGAHDPGRDRFVLFGGSTAAGYSAEVWEFDGATWEAFRVIGPEARTVPMVVYDPGQEAVLIRGGQNDIVITDNAWWWDGVGWTIVPVDAGEPPPAAMGTLNYDPKREVIVQYGGWAEGTDVPRAGVYEWGVAGP